MKKVIASLAVGACLLAGSSLSASASATTVTYPTSGGFGTNASNAASFYNSYLKQISGGYTDIYDIFNNLFKTDTGTNLTLGYVYTVTGTSGWLGKISFETSTSPTGTSGTVSFWTTSKVYTPITSQIAAVPGPIAGAGIPALLLIGGAALAFRRRNAAQAA